MARTLSTVFPKRSDRAPDELFPHIPPMVQRDAVEGSTGKNRPSLQKVVQRVQDGAGPDAHCPRRGIIIRHAVEMPGHVQDQAIPDRLAVLGRAPAPGDDRHVMRRSNRQRGLKIGLVLREDHPLGMI